MPESDPKPEAKELASLVELPDTARDDMLAAAVQAYGEGDFARAETILVGLHAVRPDDVRPVSLLASTLWLQGKHGAAETAYARAHAMDPADLYILLGLAEAKIRALKLAEAMPLLEALFAADPAGEHPAANRARTLAADLEAKLGG